MKKINIIKLAITSLFTFAFLLAVNMPSARAVTLQPPIALSYGPDSAHVLDFFQASVSAPGKGVPPPTGPFPAIILVHGGGWAVGDKADLSAWAKYFAQKGLHVFNINYRLVDATTGANQYPVPVDDVHAAVDWVRANGSNYNVDVNRIGIFGESAGGHLAAMMAPYVQAVVSWSGPMDLPLSITDPFGANGCTKGCDNTTKQQRVSDLMGCAYAVCPEAWAAASPVNYASATGAALQLVNSSLESIPLSQQHSMVTAATNAGEYVEPYEIPGSKHGKALWNVVMPDGRITQQAAFDFFTARLQ